MRSGELTLQRVTVFGRVEVLRLQASEALITGDVQVVDTQHGCFRFSAAPAGSRLPRQFESHVLSETGYLFTSRTFGHYAFAQLSAAAPPALLRGAENTSEIGAFSATKAPIRLDGLQSKIDEYMPFGLVPIYVAQT
jgi:hypothetical protein